MSDPIDAVTGVADGAAAVAQAIEASPVAAVAPPWANLLLDAIAHLNALDPWLRRVADVLPPHVHPGEPPKPPELPNALTAGPYSPLVPQPRPFPTPPGLVEPLQPLPVPPAPYPDGKGGVIWK